MGTHAITTLHPAITWQAAHAELTRLARQRAAADAEEGRWLLAARRTAVHVHWGFASFNAYVEWLFGYQPRSTQERLRVAEALESLPALDRALSEGDLNWSAVRELTRVCVPETQPDWLAFARGKTLRQLTDALAGKHPGDTPSTPPDSSAQRHSLHFDVSAETYALFRDALNELQRRSRTPLDDDAALLQMARDVLGGPADAGRASYQIAISLCPTCNTAQQLTAGAAVTVDPSLLAMAECDAQHLCPEHAAANDAAPTPPRAHHHVGAAANDAAPTPPRAHAHVGAAANDAAPTPPRAHAGARARQRTPPALRRQVLLRDQRRCQVPACRNHRFLDLHHLDLRSEGGRDSATNLVTVCGAHHRALHRGQLQLLRNPDGSLTARHADGSEYGRATNPQPLDTHAKVFSALRNLGFREGEVRATFHTLQSDPTLRAAPFDQLLCAALSLLRPARRAL